MLVREVTINLICTQCKDEVMSKHTGAISLPLHIGREIKIESPCIECGAGLEVKKIVFVPGNLGILPCH